MPEPKGTLVSHWRNVAVRTYRQEGFSSIPKVFLEEAEYARGLQRFVPSCSDVVPIDRCKRLIYLAKRRSKPMPYWWWIGGSMFPNETHEEAAVRCFARETKVKINKSQLDLVSDNDYFWKDRQQDPQDIGCHMHGYIYTLEISDAELALVALDEKEYADRAFTAFSWKGLRDAKVYPAITDLYFDLFGPH